MSSRYRYERQAFGWWFHDVVIHPISGTLGLIGNLLRSFRLMAFAHHLHNGSAPSNDSVADFIQAAGRACENESPSDPFGRKTPDEQQWESDQANIALGRDPRDPKTPFLSDEQRREILRKHAIPSWNTQACGGEPPVVGKDKAERLLMRDLSEAQEALTKLMTRTFTQREIRDMGEEGKEALRVEVRRLDRRVLQAERALARHQSGGGTSVRKLLEE